MDIRQVNIQKATTKKTFPLKDVTLKLIRRIILQGASTLKVVQKEAIPQVVHGLDINKLNVSSSCLSIKQTIKNAVLSKLTPLK